MKTLSKAVAMASLLSAGVMGAQVANAEVEYSAGLATTYLWRGTDLGGAAFSAAADYGHESGAYAGIWASSGDLALGNEYDLYVGFAKEFGDFSFDIQAVTYVYNNRTDDNGNDVAGSPGEVSDAIISLGFMDASVSYYQSLQDEDSSYITAGYSIAGADLTVGMQDDGAGAEYTHLDVSYGLTDQLSITVSKVVDSGSDAAALSSWGVDAGEDAIVVMSYSLPL
ncbi:MAG: TorF family putative porin [Bermanella sp.]